MDSVRCFTCPPVSAQVLLALRVLLVRISADGLVSLWPILLTELVSPEILVSIYCLFLRHKFFRFIVKFFFQTYALNELQSDLGIELATPQLVNRERLAWYWSACRLLEALVLLPNHILPHWQ